MNHSLIKRMAKLEYENTKLGKELRKFELFRMRKLKKLK